MTLSASDILKIDDVEIKPLKMPEWGGETIYIKVMTGTERDNWDLYSEREIKKQGGVNLRARLAVVTVCDETGKRIFDDAQFKDLAKKSGKALDRIWDAATALNRLTDQEVQDTAKN